MFSQKSCNNAEDECTHYQSLYERAQKELEDLAEKHRQVHVYVQVLYMMMVIMMVISGNDSIVMLTMIGRR